MINVLLLREINPYVKSIFCFAILIIAHFVIAKIVFSMGFSYPLELWRFIKYLPSILGPHFLLIMTIQIGITFLTVLAFLSAPQPLKIGILSLFILALALSATGSDYGPIANSVSILTTDYLAFVEMASHGDFQQSGSLYIELIRIFHAISPLFFVLLKLHNAGVSTDTLFISLYFFQTCLYLVSFILLSLSINKNYALVLLFLGFIVLSSASPLYDIRVIGSTLSNAAGFCAIALLLYGYYVPALALAALCGYFHPTYALFFATIIFGTQFLYEKHTYQKITSIIKNGALFILFLSPVIIMVLLNISDVLQSGTGPDWINFVRKINNLAFPVERGYGYLAGHLATLVLACIMCFSFFRDNKPLQRLGYVFLLCIIAYAIQIFGTYYVENEFIIKLALNHRVNGIAFPLIVLLFSFCFFKGVQSIYWPAWIILAFYFPLSKLTLFEEIGKVSLWPDMFPRDDYVKADIFIPLFAAYSLLLLQSCKGKMSYAASSMALTSMAIAFYASILFQDIVYILIFISLVLGVLIQSYTLFPKPQWMNIKYYQSTRVFHFISKKIEFLKINSISNSSIILKAGSFSTLIVISIFILEIQNRMPVGEPAHRFKSLLTEGKKPSWVQQFVNVNVPLNEKVVIIPLRAEGKRLSTLPWHMAYLDPYEAHYLLYIPSRTMNILEKLTPYSGSKKENINDITEEAWQSAIHIRRNIKAIQNYDKAAKWVLTYRRYACETDTLFAEYTKDNPKGYSSNPVLIKIEDLDPNCEF